MTDATILVFFYGSLRSGEYNNWLLSNSQKVADAHIEGFRLWSLGAFPAVVPSSDNSHRVYGELWEVDPLDFRPIDGMERSAGYTAQEVEVATNDIDEFGEAPRALVYVFRDPSWLADNGTLVESGDWSKR